MIYLSSTTNIKPEYKSEFGVMFSAKYSIGGLNDALDGGWQWMMDNNQYTGDFEIKTWLIALLKYHKYNNTCLGIPIKDKVGDALETLRLFSQYWRVVKDLGYPVAFVTQDGITPEITPWDYFDVLFVGGTDDHKLSSEAGIMIAEAKSRDKWVHVGRVNSPKRIKQFWMADSVDGTQLTVIGKGANGQSRDDRQAQDVVSIAMAVQYCRNKKAGKIKANGQYNFIGA